MQVKFWGVRGSIASASQGTAGVGGNTTCVEIRCGDELIIIDTGTGVRYLGMSLMKELPLKGTILFTHVHWDHIHVPRRTALDSRRPAHPGIHWQTQIGRQA